MKSHETADNTSHEPESGGGAQFSARDLRQRREDSPPPPEVHGPNAFQKEKQAFHEPGGTHSVASRKSGPRQSVSLQKSLCPLSYVPTGSTVRICKLLASPEIMQRMREIGFLENEVIHLISGRANIICQVQNCRMALGRKLADSILVEKVMLQGEYLKARRDHRGQPVFGLSALPQAT